MEHPAQLLGLEDARDEVFVADIALEELKVLAHSREPLEPCEVSTLEADVIVIVHLVDASPRSV